MFIAFLLQDDLPQRQSHKNTAQQGRILEATGQPQFNVIVELDENVGSLEVALIEVGMGDQGEFHFDVAEDGRRGQDANGLLNGAPCHVGCAVYQFLLTKNMQKIHNNRNILSIRKPRRISADSKTPRKRSRSDPAGWAD